MRVIKILKRVNDKLEPVSDSVLTYIESLGDKIPEYLENNMGKIYFIFFILTLFGIKEGYEQRGYFGIGGEAVSYTHLTLPTTPVACRSRWSPYH